MVFFLKCYIYIYCLETRSHHQCGIKINIFFVATTQFLMFQWSLSLFFSLASLGFWSVFFFQNKNLPLQRGSLINSWRVVLFNKAALPLQSFPPCRRKIIHGQILHSILFSPLNLTRKLFSVNCCVNLYSENSGKKKVTRSTYSLLVSPSTPLTHSLTLATLNML